jgi:glycosyltransferase involved in cell wall biosynthesis
VPPRLYGGTERIVAHLTDALVELGHDVTLFASADARTSAKLVSVRDQAMRLDPHPLKSDLAAHLSMLQELRLREDDFDVIHFHVDLIHFPFFEDLAHKTVTTLHGRLDLKDLPEAYARWPQYPLVSISSDQRRPLPAANWVRTIQHGLSDDLLRSMTEPKGDYLAFLGRISPEKRPDRAIAIARRAGVKLKIAAKVDAVDRVYFAEVIEPLLNDPAIEFLRRDWRQREVDVSRQRRRCPVSHRLARAVRPRHDRSHGVRNPVVAWRCGAVPEIVDDGVTGFMVTSEDEAVSAVKRASSLDRSEIRRTFERRFTSKIMARNYLALYWSLAHEGDPDLKVAAVG